jgi:hypothetical protein
MRATRSRPLLRLLLALLLASALVAHPTGPLPVSLPPAQAATSVGCDAAALRDAISAAGDGNTLVLTSNCTYTFDSASDDTYGPSALAITKTLTIEGNGAVLAASSPVTGLRLLMVSASGVLTLRDVELRDGYARGGDGGAADYGGGGAAGSLTLERATLTNNRAQGGQDRQHSHPQ